MAVISVLLISIFCLLITSGIANQQTEQTCHLDGTCVDNSDCKDEVEDCKIWIQQDRNLCETSDSMQRKCPKSCNACGGDKGDVENLETVVEETILNVEDEDEYGKIQTNDINYFKEIATAIEDMKIYIRKIREDQNTTPAMRELLDNCKIRHKSCAFWKVLGECEKNPNYMKKECAPICQTCEYLSVEGRCPIDPDAPVAWKPGDLNTFFLNITTLPEFAKFEPHVLSRPGFVNGDTNETAGYKIGPWVVTLDNFVTDDEADRLIQLGAEEGYKRSADVGKMKFDGTHEDSVNDGRTSLNAWCQNACYNDTAAKQVISRIEEITNIPESNSEYLQLLKYEVGQYYRSHHDYIHYQVKRQCGVRILTVFLYLNDVEEGGGTNFPKLGITVMPKKGRVLIWPSVLDENPDDKDARTDHEALPVTNGIKYGANAWVHQRDFKTPNKSGCQ